MYGFSGRKGNAIWLGLCSLGLASALWAWPAKSEQVIYQTVPSTPDIPVTAGATSVWNVPGGRASFVWIKNDCTGDLYFDLNPKANGDVSHPIRLKTGEEFRGSFNIGAVGVTPGTFTGACTFTVQFGR